MLWQVCLLTKAIYSRLIYLDLPTCTRDIAKFKALGINTIRTYAVDNTKNHDACMKLLADAGIYVAVDVGSTWISLNREYEAAINASYNDDFLQRVFATTELMSQYDNTLLFFSGNEVIEKPDKSWASPYIKAVVRDIKRYISERGLRQVPVGYAATDLPENRFELGNYLNCGSNSISRADFYALNDYSWCYPSTFEQSGWKAKVEMWMNFSIPLLYASNTNWNVY
jgi:1,3-beta-glucanosyltransferase GAS5